MDRYLDKEGKPITFEEWVRLSGPFGWVMRDAELFDEPIPCRGMQGLWQVPADVEAKIQAIRRQTRGGDLKSVVDDANAKLGKDAPALELLGEALRLAKERAP